MAQLSLYADDTLMSSLRKGAREAGVSISRYAAEILTSCQQAHGWPIGFFDLYGSIADESFMVDDGTALDPSLDVADNLF